MGCVSSLPATPVEELGAAAQADAVVLRHEWRRRGHRPRLLVGRGDGSTDPGRPGAHVARSLRPDSGTLGLCVRVVGPGVGEDARPQGPAQASEVAAGGRIRIQPKVYFATRTTTASGCGCSKRAGWWKSPFRAPGVSTSRHRLVRLRAEETIASSSRGELLKQLQSQQTMSAVWDVLRGQAGAPTVRQIAQATGEARGSVASALNGDLQGHRAIESVYGYLVAGRDELAHGTQKPQTLRACRESTRWFVLALVKVEEPGDLVWCPETGC